MTPTDLLALISRLETSQVMASPTLAYVPIKELKTLCAALRERIAQASVCAEIVSIMEEYDRQYAKNGGYVDTPGGLEHMGDVWTLLSNWRDRITLAEEGHHTMSDAEKLTAIRERATEILLPDYFIGTTRRPLLGQKADDIRELCRWILGCELPTPAVTKEQIEEVLREVFGAALEECYNERGQQRKVSEASTKVMALLSGATVAPDQWRPIETAPKDGSLLQLIVEHGEHNEDTQCDGGFENEYPFTRTMGFNNCAHDGDDVWVFPGWDWCQDQIVKQGCGRPVKWAPMLPLPASGLLSVKEG